MTANNSARPPVWINGIGTAVPGYDMHAKFVQFAPSLLPDPRQAALLRRMADRAGIAHRYSIFAPHSDPAQIDRDGVYRRGAFPDTGARMRLFEAHATHLTLRAIDALPRDMLTGITHLNVSCCTGFTGPGIDYEIAVALDLPQTVERTMVGFMGCSAALNALKLAWHQVRSDPATRVLVINLELCTLHFRETAVLEELLSYLIFADGCAASIVSTDPRGVELQGFRSTIIPETAGHITWRIGDAGFLMHLSGALPAAVGTVVGMHLPDLLGLPASEIALWAVHPGGRSILDAVERGVGCPIDLQASRDVLRGYGNMSSPTVMFVLDRIMRGGVRGQGCMLAFGPGVTVETARFRQ